MMSRRLVAVPSGKDLCCCSVLQFVAVCCILFQCVAVCCMCCSVLHACSNALQCAVSCCYTAWRRPVRLQCVAMCYNVLQCDAESSSVLNVCSSVMHCVAV